MIRQLDKEFPPYKEEEKDLTTPDSSPMKRLHATATMHSDLIPDFDKVWSMDVSISHITRCVLI